MLRVAIIGAGASGLTSAVAALEAGMLPTVFEMHQQIGGVWRSDTGDSSDLGLAWPGMKVNISRHTGTFSNFDWPPTAPDFPTTQEVYNYLSDYAKHFHVLPYIRFSCQVIEVIPTGKKWHVCWKENTDANKEEIFDYLIIATSKFTHPHVPDFNGLEKIKDKMIHSSKYRSAEEFINKKVLVIGGSLSGTAIAEEVAEKANVVHLFRKERWIIKRYRSSDPANNGPLLPRDLLKTFASSQVSFSKEEQYQSMLQHCSEQNAFPEWCMYPTSPVGFVVADNYFNEVRAGKLIPIRGEVDYFLDSRVNLKDGRSINFDAVILCTGYERDLTFLPEYLRLTSTSLLYEDTFPIEAENIAYIGMYPNARGAVFPIVELQARLVCAIFSGKLQLPSQEIMKEEIDKTPKDRDEIKFLTALAQMLGVEPDIDSLNLGLRHVLLEGAFTSARFRLSGFNHNYESALNSINETEMYRRKLLRSNNEIPSLASMCLFKLNQSKNSEVQYVDTFSLIKSV